MKDFKHKSVSAHQFAMIPKADIPRSQFRMQKGLKTTFDSGYLIPVFCEEMLPGDRYNCAMTAFARLATPIVPFMDNLWLDSFFFFVPNRLVWDNWVKLQGEQKNPGDSIAYLVPQLVSDAGGFGTLTIFDYFGLPTVGQVQPTGVVGANALPLRGYNLIYDEWFRDENLCNAVAVNAASDGPDAVASYALQRRGKRHDYFTGCLPFLQKGPSVTLPLGTSAPVITSSGAVPFTGIGTIWHDSATNLNAPANTIQMGTGGNVGMITATAVANTSDHSGGLYPINLYADLTSATAATINQLRQSFQIQRLLERDARGGTRYTEILRAHFGVMPPDFRLQRPEYIGGGTTAVNISAVAQTSATTASGSDTPQGNLSAFGTALARNHGFTYSATEHGYVIGIVSVRADLTYQQGLRRHWSRRTRYDFYFPAFAMLGEQAVLNQEIWCSGLNSGGYHDLDVFGYQERWAEYRYMPSEITGLFRSTTTDPLDVWHLAQNFAVLPSLNATFIQENPPVDRVVAIGDDAGGQQFLMDAMFDIKAARPLPMYSVPGLIDHF